MMGGTLFSSEGKLLNRLRKAGDYYWRANFTMGGTLLLKLGSWFKFKGVRKWGNYHGEGQFMMGGILFVTRRKVAQLAEKSMDYYGEANFMMGGTLSQITKLGSKG